MECTRWNKHTFLMNERQIEIMKYYQKIEKPVCKFCGKKTNVVKIIHSNKKSDDMANRPNCLSCLPYFLILRQQICPICPDIFL